ncbi:MAG: AAA family ATPase, partial [Planctomycetales bacterium]|nr:AAA family ATPase [Planctomycetales bacterium]
EGLYLHRCAEFEIWLVGERERWRQRVASVLGELMAHHSQRGEYDEGLRFARQLLALEPWREETHRQVMRLLAYSGQRGAALAQYETCRRVLAEELGVEPAEETTRLYEQIRDGELAIPVSLQAPARKHNLPVQITPFVGREAALAGIADRLQDPTCRLLTLVGPGGCGKTRLALEAAAAQVDNYAHGVFFVSLAPLDSAEAIVPTVAEALGFRFYEGGEPQQQLLDYLHQKAMLIIMDNFEHLLDGVGLVTDVLKTAPKVTILATSRARLNVQGEHLFPVAGMSFPDEETAKDASQYSAVRLFLQSACQAQPAFEVTTNSLADVARICRLVQGMPLGILLAAAWVRMLTPAEIADQISGEIGQSLDFLEADLRDVPQRQRSMRAVFDHSYRLLTQREREVFQGLSVFRGGFTHQAAQYVTDASLRELRSLVDKSLLQRDPGGRYGIHELLRQYAAEKLLGEGPAEEEAARDRHCTYYAGFLRQREAHLIGRNQKQALAEVGAEIENVRAGW